MTRNNPSATQPNQPPTEPGKMSEGITCRQCGCGDLPVTNTEKMPNGMIRRRRKCRNCGAKKVTYETDAGNLVEKWWQSKPEPDE